MMYRECENCGASLDPGEICDCRTEEAQLPAICCTQQPVIVENLDSVRNRLDGLISEVRGFPQDDESLKAVVCPLCLQELTRNVEVVDNV